MYSASRRSGIIPTQRLPLRLYLIVAGIVLAIVWNVLWNQTARGTSGNFLMGDLGTVSPPTITVLIGRAALAMVLLGGIFCALEPLGGRARRYRILLCCSICYSVILATRNLEPRDLLTSSIYSPLAPGCAIASCLLLASLDRDHWRTLIRFIAYGTIGVSILAVLAMANIHSRSRGEAYAHLYTYSSILEVTAIVAYGWSAKSHRTWLGVIPVLVLIATTIALQTRLMVVEVVCLFGFYRLLSQRTLSIYRVAAMFLVPLILMSVAYLVWYSPTIQSIVPDSAVSFWDRRTEDTRSQQFVNFFQKVPTGTFLLGIGIPRPGEFTGLGSHGIDLGYVNILFIGGIPALAFFLLIHIVPAVRCIRYRFDPVDAACVASVMTFGVRMFSSTIPNFEPAYLLLLLLVGRCIALSDRTTDSSRSRPWAVQVEPARNPRPMVTEAR